MSRQSLQKALREFKKKHAAWLPGDYESYLLAGSPWDRSRLNEIQALTKEHLQRYKYDAVILNRPYALERQGETSPSILIEINDIVLSRKRGSGLLPPHTIAIGRAQTLEDIILYVDGPRKGQVWLKGWFRLEEEDIDDPADDLFHIADTFGEFMKKIGQTW